MEHHNHHDSDHSSHDMSGVNLKKERGKFTIILLFILLLSLIHSITIGLNYANLMRSFMGFFFLIFAFAKLLDLKEFAYGFASYDIIAKRSIFYGYIYPFIELGLGIIFILGVYIDQFLLFTIMLMIISSIGALNSVFNKKAIKCACLGNLVQLPVSNITLVEDLGMGIMAIIMLVF